MRRDRHNSYLVRLVVSHGEGKGLWEVTGGHLCSVIIRRATAGRTVEGDWNLENTEVNVRGSVWTVEVPVMVKSC